MIGILGALDEEMDLIREALTDCTAVEKAGNIFHCGKLGEMEVTVIRPGHHQMASAGIRRRLYRNGGRLRGLYL